MFKTFRIISLLHKLSVNYLLAAASTNNYAIYLYSVKCFHEAHKLIMNTLIKLCSLQLYSTTKYARKINKHKKCNKTFLRLYKRKKFIVIKLCLERRL